MSESVRHGFLHDSRGNRSTTRLLPFVALALAFIAFLIGTRVEAKWLAAHFIEKSIWLAAIVLAGGKGMEELSGAAAKVVAWVKQKGGGDASS